MRLRQIVAALLLATTAALASSCGGGDEYGCENGTVLNSCFACSCPAGKETTCTAYPVGDTTSTRRCCTCT